MTEKFYTVKPEYYSLWGENVDAETILTTEEVLALADEWGKTLDEVLAQLDKHERTGISIDNGIPCTTPEAALEKIPLSTMAEYMDDEARENTARRYAPCSDLWFLYNYLEDAPADLIIG